MPELEFEVWCGRCGAGLCGSTLVKGSSVTVEPCEDCLAKIRSEGYDEGHDDGFMEGKEGCEE